MPQTDFENRKLRSLLILETDDVQRKGLCVALIDYFLLIQITSQPMEAIEFAKNEKFDVIISEVHFDSLNGSDAITTLKLLNPRAYFIVLSSHLNHELKTRLKKVQVDCVIEKPVSLKQIRNKIQEQINIQFSRDH